MCMTPLNVPRPRVCAGEAGYKEVTLLGQNVDAYGRCVRVCCHVCILYYDLDVCFPLTCYL